MTMHLPHHDYLVEEMRGLARRHYGPKQPGQPPIEHRLVNIERLTTLYSIAHNPYHRMVFAPLSAIQLLRVCAYNLMESLNYREAGKLLLQVERLEAARDAAPGLEASAPDAPADTYVIDPEAVPVEPPPHSAEDAYLRSLSDRELARQHQAAQRRRAEA